MADDFGYHIDQHGSLVRPPSLLAARASGDHAALAAAEDEAAVAVAHVQRRLTLSACGDGQFRREHFESVVYDHVDGFSPADGPAPLTDLAGIPAARRRAVSASPAARGRLAQAEVAPVLATVDRPVFVALPSPGYLAAVGSALADSAAVAAVRECGAALAAILRAEISALAGDGVAYVALGNPLYPPLLTVDGRTVLAAACVDPDAVLAALVEADRAAADGLDVPTDFRVGLDLTDSGPLPTTAAGRRPGCSTTRCAAFSRMPPPPRSAAGKRLNCAIGVAGAASIARSSSSALLSRGPSGRRRTGARRFRRCRRKCG